MNKLQEISNHPDYDSKASSFSKLIIAVFFISYVYIIFTNSNNVGWVGIIVFLFAGLFISSIVIAAPFFIIKRIFPKISTIVVIISIITTFFITRVVFNLVFNQPNETTASSVLPHKFFNDSKEQIDNENFKQSIILLNEARDLSNPPESQNQTVFELSKEIEEKIYSNNEEGIRLGKLVSDDYLDYLHTELKNMFKNKLLKGTEIYYDGLIKNNADNIAEGVQKQIQGNQLIIEWIDWFDKNGKSITDKVFND